MSRPQRPYSPPPGQVNHSAPGYDDHHRRASQLHFDPPPTSAYEDYDGPRDPYQDGRPYAPSDPRAHSFNQVTPYYDDNVEAGSARSWDERQAYTRRLPPPPSDYELGRSPRPPAGNRFREGQYEYRYDNRCQNRYDDRNDKWHQDAYDDRFDPRYEDERSYDDRDRRDRTRRRRRRSTGDEMKERALGSPSRKSGRDTLGGSERERGIAAKLIGGAGGALIGQTLGRGHTLETIAGAAVGAIAATALEKQVEKRREEKVVMRRGRDGPPAGPYPQSGRDVRDGRETARDDARLGLKERLRSLSRRAARSLSRRRPSEDMRRRRDSYGSVDSLGREGTR